jgi:hypothetical protein
VATVYERGAAGEQQIRDALADVSQPPRARLVRDEHGEPVRELRDRDSKGRYSEPYYAYIWEPEPGAPGGQRTESRPMKDSELGRYVCVTRPAAGCLHRSTTVSADGVWVKTGQQWSTAHRDCYQAWQREQAGGA